MNGLFVYIYRGAKQGNKVPGRDFLMKFRSSSLAREVFRGKKRVLLKLRMKYKYSDDEAMKTSFDLRLCGRCGCVCRGRR